MLLTLAAVAFGAPDTTRESLERLEELLEIRLEDGVFTREDVLPALLVSAEPRYEASVEWYGTRVIEILQRAFGNEGLRLCEACMAPRAFVEDGVVVYQTGPVGLDEVARLDDRTRGDAQPARSAIWIDEHRRGVSVRIVDLGTGRVIYAQNVDPDLVENANTQRVYTQSAELERRAEGRGLTQTFVDAAFYPGQHLSIDWTDQWGKRNYNLTGVSLSLFDPVIGLGATHARRTPLFNTLVGGKVIVSLPTALTRAIGDQDIDGLDPMLTGVGFVRVPIGRSNYGVLASASTNGRIGLGISLMNISLLPVIP